MNFYFEIFMSVMFFQIFVTKHSVNDEKNHCDNFVIW